MLTPPDDDTTPWIPLKTGRCSGCQSGRSACFAYPSTNMELRLCQECIRGAVVAVSRETRRRATTKVAKT